LTRRLGIDSGHAQMPIAIIELISLKRGHGALYSFTRDPEQGGTPRPTGGPPDGPVGCSLTLRLYSLYKRGDHHPSSVFDDAI